MCLDFFFFFFFSSNVDCLKFFTLWSNYLEVINCGILLVKSKGFAVFFCSVFNFLLLVKVFLFCCVVAQWSHNSGMQQQ